MKVSRRQALRVSGTAFTGFSLGLRPTPLRARAGRVSQEAPGGLVETPIRELAELPLLRDGSAPEHPPRSAGSIEGPTIWRYTNGEPPPIEFDYRRLAVTVEARGTATRSGTLTFPDLEALPREMRETAVSGS